MKNRNWILAMVFCVPFHFARADVSSMVADMNQAAGNMRSMGRSGTVTIMPGQPNPQLNRILEVAKSPSILAEIERLEVRLNQSARVLANPQADSSSARLASQRMARTGPELIRLLDARASLVTAINGALRTTVAQAQGVRPYVSARGSWLTTTLQIVRDTQANMGRARPAETNATFRESLARGIRAAFQNNVYNVRSQFYPSQLRGRGTPLETPDIITVDGDGNAHISQ